MRTSGHVIGAFARVATRRSVIFSSDGFEFVFVFCGSASSTSSAQNDEAANAPVPFRKPRRPMPFDTLPIEIHHPSGGKLITVPLTASGALAYTLHIGSSERGHEGSDRCRSTCIYHFSTSSGSSRHAHEFPPHFR